MEIKSREKTDQRHYSAPRWTVSILPRDERKLEGVNTTCEPPVGSSNAHDPSQDAARQKLRSSLKVAPAVGHTSGKAGGETRSCLVQRAFLLYDCYLLFRRYSLLQEKCSWVTSGGMGILLEESELLPRLVTLV